jgi:protein-L-isoaspartate(D-aspartate) O-methyltransferase
MHDLPSGRGEREPLAQPDQLAQRERMVTRDLAGRGIRDARVLQAFRQVPREAFVEPGWEALAYDDAPLPIGDGQTISQPYMVATMMEAAEIRAGDRVLEIGAGSGYAAAIASRLAAEVLAIERHAGLGERARERLQHLGYANVQVIVADGSLGWPAAAPYDVIIVSAAAPVVPPALEAQLAAGGRLLLPVGEPGRVQTLARIRRTADGIQKPELLAKVSFVPLVGGGSTPA